MKYNIESTIYDIHIGKKQQLRFHLVTGDILRCVLIAYTEKVYVVKRILYSNDLIIVVKNNVVCIDPDPDAE